MPEPSRHVFVYGTLRRGQANDINRQQPAPAFVGHAVISGTLYDLGPYPGLVLGGGGVVKGEVYTVSYALERRLDEIEEILPEPTGEYHKREVVIDVVGRATPCLVYEIDWQRATGHRVIASGDWLLRD